MNMSTIPWRFSGDTTPTGERIFTKGKGTRILESLLSASDRVALTLPDAQRPAPALKADSLEAHPFWPEWAALSPSVKAACRSDFRVFLVVREKGMLSSLVARIGKDIERAAASEDRERDRQDLEQHLAAARDPNQFEAIMAHRDKDKLDFQKQLAAAAESARQHRRDRERGVTA